MSTKWIFILLRWGSSWWRAEKKMMNPLETCASLCSMDDVKDVVANLLFIVLLLLRIFHLHNNVFTILFATTLLVFAIVNEKVFKVIVHLLQVVTLYYSFFFVNKFLFCLFAIRIPGQFFTSSQSVIRFRSMWTMLHHSMVYKLQVGCTPFYLLLSCKPISSNKNETLLFVVLLNFSKPLFSL